MLKTALCKHSDTKTLKFIQVIGFDVSVAIDHTTSLRCMTFEYLNTKTKTDALGHSTGRQFGVVKIDKLVAIK